MEKIPSKYAVIIRVFCYLLIPIFILSMIQSIIALIYVQEQGGRIETDNYFHSQAYANLYKESILNNVEACYSYVQNEGYKINLSNLHGVSEINSSEGNIYYRTYLENKNFKFLIIDTKTNTAFTNLELTMKTDSVEKIKQELASYNYFWNYEIGNITTNIDNLSIENMKYSYYYERIEKDYECIIYTAMKDPLVYYDNYYTSYFVYEIADMSQETAYINLPLSVVLIFVCVLLLGIYAGRKKGEKEIYLNFIDKVPLEIIVAFVLVITCLVFVICTQNINNINIFYVICISVLASILYVIGLISYETLVKRIKTQTIFKNTVIYRLAKIIINGTKNIFNNFNLAIKIAIVIGALGIVTSILANCGFWGFFILFIVYIIIFKLVFWYARKLLEIKEATKQIYEGNIEVYLDREEYKGVLKELCIYINDIASGFTNAIEEGVKSERMKTELITNVSHDIKTPLTSIINYVDLLKKEEMPNEKTREYLDILDEKSQRLKHLTEDLVEASKVSSGNIKLNLEKIDVRELIKQVSGEFEDKLKDKKLQLILNIPEENTKIIADGRYLYRIIENMYSNIVKYALPDSRVYVDIILDKEKVKIELKNISKEKLNISAEELMERFVRGETSRNTEGSGLGLSIAQSLTQLQNGEFNIYLDGDLFKVTITFEKVK